VARRLDERIFEKEKVCGLLLVSSAPFTYGSYGTRIVCLWKISSWRCDVLGNLLLGYTGSGHLCGHAFDMCHLPKHCCRPDTILNDNESGLFQQRIMHPAKLHTLFKNDLRNMMKSSRCCLGP